MSGEANLDALLKNMDPEIQEGSFVFLTSKDAFPAAVQSESVMIFRETEGMTIIVRSTIAEVLKKAKEPHWAMITLNVHSDLNAVGFLAVITSRFAEAGISVNAVSAFYHDHLFVPWQKREEAMEVLRIMAK